MEWLAWMNDPQAWVSLATLTLLEIVLGVDNIIFLTILVNFIILAFIIFMMVKQMNRLRKEEPAPPAEAPPTPEDVLLLRQIRDSLQK